MQQCWFENLLSARNVTFLYFSVALALGTTQVFLVPPMQTPDEDAHLLRSAQLVDGEWLSRANPQGPSHGGGGANIDLSVPKLSVLFLHIPFHGEVKIDARTLARARELRWSGTSAFLENPAAAVYPPTFYIPQALGLLVGKNAGFGILDSFYLARFFNMISAIVVSSIAVLLAREGRVLMMVVLLLPMTLCQMSSVSQDAGLIACCALVCSLLSRIATTHHPARLFGALAILSAAIGTSRLPLLAYALILILPAWSRSAHPINWQWRWAAFLGVVASGVIWACCATILYWDEASVGSTISFAQQARLLGHNPMVFFQAVRNTVCIHGVEWTRMFVGVLGWLDVPLPEISYLFGYSALGLACCASLGDHFLLRRSDKAYLALAVLAAVTAMLLIFYLTWTPVGDAEVHGMQGRYFLCVAPFLGLLLPGFRYAERMRSYFEGAAIVASLLCLVGMPMAIFLRYYVAQI